ncbi:HupE/UreJ family protein [Thiobacillus sedimenti]|uniref:HupE/UreJ family protein n=1 Tax=Thiobacillus sedimenti TaxID=3110231 RepID=A0ABZ1CMG3_9PROT|nr:HupE/UreJ family protein [Thiobacillus sp. SCUT-2]WRS40575.1 HupE/UreJ family protein [Thiobacillus sp. SCUT-2]
MKPSILSRAVTLVVLCLAAGSAAAHPGHLAAGFAGGLAHPFMGLDHMLAMIAVGLWAAQLGGHARWAVPTSFVGAMGAGGALAWTGAVLPHVETGIALSVLVLGLLVATRRQWPVAAGAAIAAVFALFHGYAHGLEMPQVASPVLYALGFTVATMSLHAVGLAASVVGRRAMQLAGIAITAAGLTLVLGV